MTDDTKSKIMEIITKDAKIKEYDFWCECSTCKKLKMKVRDGLPIPFKTSRIVFPWTKTQRLGEKK